MKTYEIQAYKECDACSKRPGTPTLCSGCLNNQKAIEQRDKIIEELLYKVEVINVLINKI